MSVDAASNKSGLTAGILIGGATLGSALYDGGRTYFAQRQILQKPDEFIKKVEGEIASKKRMNTPFLRGTQDAADLANKELDQYLAKLKKFANGGKYEWGTILKRAGIGALIGLAGSALVYGIIKLCKGWGKKASEKVKEHQIEVLSEGIKQANTENVK